MIGALHVVYVEDDAFSREVMAVLVRVHLPDAALTIMADSADFVARVDQLDTAPDLFLLDVHVQPLDGIAMLRLLRGHRRYAKARIVAVTASVMNQEIVQLRSAGFNGAIGKPLDFDQFASLIDKVIHGEEVWYVS